MSEDPGMRASDADREATARRLQDAHAEGRLTLEELSERLDRTAVARTLGELAEQTRDLPAEPPRPLGGPSTRPAEPVAAPAQVPARAGDRGVRQAWRGYLSACAVCIIVWGVVAIATRSTQGYWPIYLIGFGLIGPVQRMLSRPRS